MPAHRSISGSKVTVAQQLAATTPVLGSNGAGNLAFIHHHFPASAGAMGHPTQLRLALVIKGGGRLQQICPRRAALDAHWHIGQFNVVLPGQTGTYSSPAVEVLGLAIDWPALGATAVSLPTLAPLTGALHRDATVSALLHALWAASRSGVLSDELLHACGNAVLDRLVQMAQRPAALSAGARVLSAAQMKRLTDYIDAARDVRLTVPMMADALGMDDTRLSRGLQAAAGMSPYQFLVHRRMHWARGELERGVSVMRVAQSVGYANASKFSAAYRRVMGCAPSASVG